MGRLDTKALLIYLVISASAIPTLYGQTEVISVNTKGVKLLEVARLPKILKEASGLEITGGKYLWAHNDGGIPALYQLDTLGNLIRAIHINASNRGWEDVAVNESGEMFIGSFGNNTNDRKDLKIFKIANPETSDEAVAIPRIISFSYNDQMHFPPAIDKRNFDVDAFFAWRGSLYLFTKNRSIPFRGISKIYRLSQEPGHQVAKLIDSLFVGPGPMLDNWITGVDLSPDEKTLALLFHDRVWFIRNFDETNFSKGTVYELRLNHYSHKAGIAFMTNNLLYIVDELEFGVIGGKLYAISVPLIPKEPGD